MWIKWLAFFLLTAPAWGYRFTTDFGNGFYWENLPVNFLVSESDTTRKSLLTDLTKAAINEWESKTGLTIWNFTSSGTKNIIRWSSKFASETGMDPNSVLAVTIRYTNGPYWAKSEIIINGSHPYNQNQNYLYTTITHELGHTIGLDHSEVEQAVMAPSLQLWYNGLHSDDIQGMTAAHDEITNRQVTGFVSPLAYEETSTSKQPLSCGTVGPAVAGNSGLNGILSMISGILIGFVRKFLKWFKSHI